MKIREFYFTKGSQDQFCLFRDENGRFFSRVSERVFIFLNCPKGRVK